MFWSKWGPDLLSMSITEICRDDKSQKWGIQHTGKWKQATGRNITALVKTASVTEIYIRNENAKEIYLEIFKYMITGTMVYMYISPQSSCAHRWRLGKWLDRGGMILSRWVHRWVYSDFNAGMWSQVGGGGPLGHGLSPSFFLELSLCFLLDMLRGFLLCHDSPAMEPADYGLNPLQTVSHFLFSVVSVSYEEKCTWDNCIFILGSVLHSSMILKEWQSIASQSVSS